MSSNLTHPTNLTAGITDPDDADNERAFAIHRAKEFVQRYDQIWRQPRGILGEAQEVIKRMHTKGNRGVAALMARRDQDQSQRLIVEAREHGESLFPRSRTPQSIVVESPSLINSQETRPQDSVPQNADLTHSSVALAHEAQTNSPACIYEIPQLQMRDKLIDITENGKATLGKFRLLDCEMFSDDYPIWNRKISVHEFDEFPPKASVSYAALSYVWRGNPVPPDAASAWGKFNVRGAAEDSDPIGIAILSVVCQAAWRTGYKYLWIDRLCIIQDNRDDKAHQIRNMYSIYRHCGICLVLPGGIQRVVPLHEETNWITRAWTLQEVVAPERVYVVYDRFGSRSKHEWCGKQVIDVFPDATHLYSMAPLEDILADAIPLRGCVGNCPAIIRSTEGDFMTSENARVQLIALWGAMKLKGAAKEQAIWRSALMRTSFRPVDMVFSIMGLFDVTLDTHAYSANDRLLASRALAQATLQTGRQANWLAISFFLPPSTHLSTFPAMPQIALVDGIVRIGYTLPDDSWREVAGMMNNYSDAKWWLADMPSPASMDDAGYLRVSSHAAGVQLVGCGREFLRGVDNMVLDADESVASGAVAVVATDGTVWEIVSDPLNAPDGPDHCRAFIVFIGRQYPWAESDWVGDCTVRCVVVEAHAAGKYRIRAWCWLGDIFLDWIRSVWPVQSFSIGGPD